jgi:murein DD-endopeptidase MepM/ murein hydrolase activator NlpD
VGLPLCITAVVIIAATGLYPSGGVANPQAAFVMSETAGEQAYYTLPLPNHRTDSTDSPVTEKATVTDATTPVESTEPGPEIQQIALATAELISGAESLVTDLAGPATTGTWHSETVRKGDTLSAIFKRAGQSQTTLHRLLQVEGLDREFRRLRPGEEVRFRVHDDELQELAYAADALSTLYIARGGEDWAARTVATPSEVRTRFVGGLIEQSLYLSALEAGLNERLIMELVGIFGWDVDFALDIRAGDRFGLIFEEIYAEDGTKLADGAILAASFTNQGKSFHAVRFADSSGTPNYFAPDGYSMRKAFLRSPGDFRRITSRFRGSRYHPVLGVKRPHKGVDYAAATGTPVKASGDGKVVHAARKGGYGKTVILQHGGRYRTLYAHLNGYARGIKSGMRVRQGQTIGYVGATGLATGPHLHYEFLVDGVHRNPLTVDLPKADPLDKKLLPNFRAVAEPLLAQLTVHEQTLVAQNEQ